MRNRIYFLTSADLKGHYKPIQASHAVVNAVAVGENAGKMQKPLVTCAKGPSSAHCLELWKAGQGPWRLSPVLSQTWAIVRLGWGGGVDDSSPCSCASQLWTSFPRLPPRPNVFRSPAGCTPPRARVCVCLRESGRERKSEGVCECVRAARSPRESGGSFTD